MISDWLNKNMHRAFPFREDSSFSTNAPASWKFPISAIVDFSMHDLTRDIPTDTNVTMTSVGCDDAGAYIKFSYRGLVLECRVPASIQDAVACPVVPESPPPGVFVHGTVTLCQFTPPNKDYEYSFTDPPEILPTRVVHIPMGRGVTSISAYDRSGNRVSAGSEYGVDLHLGPNCYCDLRIYDGVVNMEASETSGLGQCCSEQSLEDSCKNKLLFINGQIANSSGNIDIEAGPGITVRPSGMIFVPELGTSIPSVTIKAAPSLRAFLT